MTDKIKGEQLTLIVLVTHPSALSLCQRSLSWAQNAAHCAHAVLEHHLFTSKDNGCGGRISCPCPDNACLCPRGTDSTVPQKLRVWGPKWGKAWQAYKAEHCTRTCLTLHTRNISDTNTDDSAAAVQVETHQKLKKMRHTMDQKITCLWTSRLLCFPTDTESRTNSER